MSNLCFAVAKLRTFECEISILQNGLVYKITNIRYVLKKSVIFEALANKLLNKIVFVMKHDNV